MNDNLLNDFEDKYLTNKKRRMIRYLIIGGVSISVIAIIIIIIVVAQNDSKSDNGNNEEQEQENPKNPEKDLEEEEEKKEKEEEESEQPTSGCPEIKLVKGGKTGSGHATRYWDCCKPSCTWTNNAGSGNEARQCDKNMNILNDLNAKSICENGGISTTCLSQIPFTINGCDDIGFAFGAVPSFYPNTCGKCFLLQFTGEGKYETKPSHVLLKNKKLIIMASNIGSDVENGQFDIMIPGGGEGIYRGCSEILGNNLGKQYGGLLEDCQEEVGYSYDDNTICVKRKECLINKCNNSFSSKPLAKEGCLFLANFLEAAGNPKHTYQEIECPQVLKDKY